MILPREFPDFFFCLSYRGPFFLSRSHLLNFRPLGTVFFFFFDFTVNSHSLALERSASFVSLTMFSYDGASFLVFAKRPSFPDKPLDYCACICPILSLAISHLYSDVALSESFFFSFSGPSAISVARLMAAELVVHFPFFPFFPPLRPKDYDSSSSPSNFRSVLLVAFLRAALPAIWARGPGVFCVSFPTTVEDSPGPLLPCPLPRASVHRV